MTRATRLLCLLHLVGNAALLWLGYYWLGVGESTVPRVVWSLMVALVIVCGAAWLHGAALAYFREGDRSTLKPALVDALRHLVPLFVLGLIVLLIYGLLAFWQDYSAKPAFKIASYLTLKLRKPLKPATVLAVFNGVLWVVRWLLLPVLLLPVAADVTAKGWRMNPAEAWKRALAWRYWIEVLVLMILAIWAPLKLIAWVPGVGGFKMQMTSFVVRLAIAYLLFVAGWLLMELFSSGGSPRVTHVKTVAAS